MTSANVPTKVTWISRDAAGSADAASAKAIPPVCTMREMGRLSRDHLRDGDEVVIGSRNEKPLTRYFP